MTFPSCIRSVVGPSVAACALASLVALSILAAGCAKPGAKDVCAKIEAAGIGKSCQQVVPQMTSVRAKERYEFELVTLPGQRGAVMSFANGEDYKATVDAYTATAMLAGPHRYGNEKALVFVQLNPDASLDLGDRTKDLVDGL